MRARRGGPPYNASPARAIGLDSRSARESCDRSSRNSRVVPEDSTLTSIDLWSTAARRTCQLTSFHDRTGSPSIARTISPARNPERSAGVPIVGAATTGRGSITPTTFKDQ
jgi:hypothetical protein